jgi:hypothetical protein
MAPSIRIIIGTNKTIIVLILIMIHMALVAVAKTTIIHLAGTTQIETIMRNTTARGGDIGATTISIYTMITEVDVGEDEAAVTMAVDEGIEGEGEEVGEAAETIAILLIGIETAGIQTINEEAIEVDAVAAEGGIGTVRLGEMGTSVTADALQIQKMMTMSHISALVDPAVLRLVEVMH